MISVARKPGRPPIPESIRAAIVAIHAEHPNWSIRREAEEVRARTGVPVHHNTVQRYRSGREPRPVEAGGPDTFTIQRGDWTAKGEKVERGPDDPGWVVRVEAIGGGDVLPDSDYIHVFVDHEGNARWLAGALLRTLTGRAKRERREG